MTSTSTHARNTPEPDNTSRGNDGDILIWYVLQDLLSDIYNDATAYDMSNDDPFCEEESPESDERCGQRKKQDVEFIMDRRRANRISAEQMDHDHNKHLYISTPVCSHYKMLSYLMYLGGINDMLTDQPYNSDLIRAIMYNIKARKIQYGPNRNVKYYYVIAADISNYLSAMCKFHLLPVLVRKHTLTKEAHLEAAKQLRRFGANLSGCVSDYPFEFSVHDASVVSWPTVLFNDSLHSHIIISKSICNRLFEIRRFVNVISTEMMKQSRWNIIDRTRLQIYMSDIEERYERAIANEDRLTRENEALSADNRRLRSDCFQGTVVNQETELLKEELKERSKEVETLRAELNRNTLKYENDLLRYENEEMKQEMEEMREELLALKRECDRKCPADSTEKDSKPKQFLIIPASNTVAIPVPESTSTSMMRSVHEEDHTMAHTLLDMSVGGRRECDYLGARPQEVVTASDVTRFERELDMMSQTGNYEQQGYADSTLSYANSTTNTTVDYAPLLTPLVYEVAEEKPDKRADVALNIPSAEALRHRSFFSPSSRPLPLSSPGTSRRPIYLSAHTPTPAPLAIARPRPVVRSVQSIKPSDDPTSYFSNPSTSSSSSKSKSDAFATLPVLSEFLSPIPLSVSSSSSSVVSSSSTPASSLSPGPPTSPLPLSEVRFATGTKRKVEDNQGTKLVKKYK